MSTKFKNRISEYPLRRRLTIISQSANEILADIVREEGQIEESGTPITADILNAWDDDVQNAKEIAQSAQSVSAQASAGASTAMQVAEQAGTTAQQANNTALSALQSVNTALEKVTSIEQQLAQGISLGNGISCYTEQNENQNSILVIEFLETQEEV